MTIYIDNCKTPVITRRGGVKWKASHLFCFPKTTEELYELHGVAESAGLETWYYKLRGYPHYEVTQTERQACIRYGAIPIAKERVRTLIQSAIEAGEA